MTTQIKPILDNHEMDKTVKLFMGEFVAKSGKQTITQTDFDEFILLGMHLWYTEKNAGWRRLSSVPGFRLTNTSDYVRSMLNRFCKRFPDAWKKSALRSVEVFDQGERVKTPIDERC